MKEDFLGDRKRALEDSFFAKYNAQLLADLKQKDATTAKRQALAEVSGIDDEKVLSRLTELNIESETLAALTLTPLVEVAWADGSLDQKEREAILQAAGKQGIAPGTASYKLLESWLSRIPQKGLLDAWKDYIGELVNNIGDQEREQLKSQLLLRARQVAEAAGGFLGFSKVSDDEERILRDLESAF